MKKKALSELPRPKTKKGYSKLLKRFPEMRGIVTAERTIVQGTETLVINCFKSKKKTVVPWFRTFCQEEEYISQDLTVKETKWRTGAFDYLAQYYVSYSTSKKSRFVLESGDKETIIGFFMEWRKRNNITDDDSGFEFDNYIDSYQTEIRQRKLAEKHRKICERIDGRMELFGELPGDYQDFVEKTVFDENNYFFYSRKEKRAFCTRCGHEYEIRKDGIYHRKIAVWNISLNLKHNSPYFCPHCGKPIVAKSEGYGRNSLYEARWSAIIQANGESVLVRYFCHTKDFRRDFRNPEIKSSEMFRTIHTAECSEDYEWGEYKNSRRFRWCYPKGHGYMWNPSEFQVPRETVLYNTDLGFLGKTCMKYSCFDIFLERIVPKMRYVSAWIADNYFNFYRRNPYIEQFLKIGWFTLTRELFEDTRNEAERFTNGRNILETCGITRTQFLILREASFDDPDLKDFKILRRAVQKGMRLTADELHGLRNITDVECFGLLDEYLDAMENTTLHKLKKYLSRQRIRHAQDYFDYTGWLSEMGYDMKNEFNIYPKDFRTSHDEMAKAYQNHKDRKHREDLRKFNILLKRLREKVDVDNPINIRLEGLFIRLPYKVTELKTEGEKLHHCVGTYVDRVMKGETTIFFVRKIENPDMPYYTLEWRDHKVVQCRGSHNCDMTPEVKAFTEIFEEKMREYEMAREAV